MAGDLPVTGDWSGTGRTNIGVYRNGDWYLDIDGDGIWNAAVDKHFSFGGAGYAPFTGNWTGDGKWKAGLFQGVSPNNAFFTIDYDGNGTYDMPPDFSTSYGLRTDIPVIGQWGSTKASRIGIFRDGTWNVDVNGDYVWNGSVDRAMTFGATGDVPVVFSRP
jgi:hypothetical protein